MEKDRVKKKTIRGKEDKELWVKRLHRIEGQIRGVSKMIEEDRYCDDI